MNWRTRMNARILQTSVGLVGLGAALVIGTITPTEINAQRSPLITAGNRANFGAITLQGGFMPDPHMHAVVSGGSIDVSPFTLAPGCRGFVTAQPDVIFHYNGPVPALLCPRGGRHHPCDQRWCGPLALRRRQRWWNQSDGQSLGTSRWSVRHLGRQLPIG